MKGGEENGNGNEDCLLVFYWEHWQADCMGMTLNETLLGIDSWYYRNDGHLW